MPPQHTVQRRKPGSIRLSDRGREGGMCVAMGLELGGMAGFTGTVPDENAEAESQSLRRLPLARDFLAEEPTLARLSRKPCFK